MASALSTTPVDDSAPPAAHVGMPLLALATAGAVVSIQQTLVIPLLPRLMSIFHATVTDVTWVFTASLLAGAVATPLLSRFRAMYAKKQVILVTSGIRLIGSGGCPEPGSHPAPS